MGKSRLLVVEDDIDIGNMLKITATLPAVLARRDQTDANGVTVAIGAREPLERGSGVLRCSARTKGHCPPSVVNRIRR